MVLLIIILLLIYAAYALLESNYLYAQAQSDKLEQFKPEGSQSLSFSELQEINPDVIAWLEVYGTKIDYPVLYSEESNKYLDTAVDGSYSMAGSIYLDANNSPDFIDFNTIIYGHHMEESAMFGDLDKFLEEDFFDNHMYGNLHFGGRDYGLEFFSYIVADAYDWKLYNPGIDVSQNKKSDYLLYLKESALYYREIDIMANDRIVLLSTCAPEPTNGRHILVAKITDEVFTNNFLDNETSKKKFSIDIQTVISNMKSMGFIKIMIIFSIIVILVIALMKLERHLIKKRKKSMENK